MKITGKAVSRFLFKASITEDDTFICNKCRRPKRSPKGYTNLVSHARTCYGPDFETELKQHLQQHGVDVGDDGAIPKKIDQKVLESFYRSNDKEQRAFAWIKWLCTRNMPLTEAANEITREFSKWEGFSPKTLRKYIIATANETVKPISETLKKSGLITLLFDGWTCDGTSTHYIAIFAGYRDPSTGKYEEVLLSLQPTLDEMDMGADAHIDLVESTLDLYKLEKDMVVCIVGDNCATNRAISRRWNIPLIGCYNHKLNLAVQEYIEQQRGLPEVIDKISTLMSKACNLKMAAQLRDLTLEAHGVSLKAKQKNKTRWTSTFDMAKRYIRIKAELLQVQGLEDYQLSARENRMVTSAMQDFEAFSYVTTQIQEKGMDVRFCREQFDILLSEPKYDCMRKYLAPDAEIVESPVFERGIIKIQNGLKLTEEEARACRKLQTQQTESLSQEEEAANEAMTVMQRLLANGKRRKVEASKSVDYVDIGTLICATSNCCERLFSEAKYIMVPHRRGMSPLLFECLIYLKKNISFWNIKTVAAAILRADKDDDEDTIFERDGDAYYK
jgi:hypothetical protein